MKLIDILARELKEWPEDCPAIERDRRSSCLFKVGGPPLAMYVGNMAEDADTAKVTYAQWQAAVDALAKPSSPAWGGIGLPPVGTVCEYQTWVNREWKQTKVLAHHLGFAVHSWSIDGDDMEVDAAPPQDFRPIRTPEQIAADEREGVMEDMRKTMERTSSKSWVEALYDAGYRKQANND